MRIWLALHLRRVAEWLDPAPLQALLDGLQLRARALTAAQEPLFTGPGFGEAKRHNVYAQLQKDFPRLSRRVISRAIEDALGD